MTALTQQKSIDIVEKIVVIRNQEKQPDEFLS